MIPKAKPPIKSAFTINGFPRFMVNGKMIIPKINEIPKMVETKSAESLDVVISNARFAYPNRVSETPAPINIEIGINKYFLSILVFSSGFIIKYNERITNTKPAIFKGVMASLKRYKSAKTGITTDFLLDLAVMVTRNF